MEGDVGAPNRGEEERLTAGIAGRLKLVPGVEFIGGYGGQSDVSPRDAASAERTGGRSMSTVDTPAGCAEPVCP